MVTALQIMHADAALSCAGLVLLSYGMMLRTEARPTVSGNSIIDLALLACAASSVCTLAIYIGWVVS